MQKFAFHILGLVHLPCSKEYMSCAFTQKNYKFAEMMLSLGHTVYYYGVEGSTIPCTEFIQTHSLKDIRKAWGDGDNRFDIGYDWRNTDFRHDFNTKKTDVTNLFYKNCIEEIKKRSEPDHFLLCTQGAYHSPVADAVKLFLTCEPGIGYRGSVKERFRAFESSYIQNFTYGSEAPYQCINGSYYDRVIPNYFSDDDVQFSDHKEDYYLFIGRMIKRKGILTAALACEAIGKKLIIAGQGASVNKNGYLVPNDSPDFYLKPGTWEYAGYCDVEKRKKLMAGAIATFTPTEYLECFAGTHIESMLHGTPPITTNFGVFPGTIPDHLNGEIGFRCNTLQDFVDAAIAAKNVDQYKVRQYGERFLTDNVKHEFNKWFTDLYQLYESTVDKNKKAWHRIKSTIHS
jgi:glycosyltransferase involved in cell wall biosynthesis